MKFKSPNESVSCHTHNMLKGFDTVRIETPRNWTIVTNRLWEEFIENARYTLMDRLLELNTEEPAYLEQTLDSQRFLLRIEPNIRTVFVATSDALMERQRTALLSRLIQEDPNNTEAVKTHSQLEAFLSHFPDEGVLLGELDPVFENTRPYGYPSDQDDKVHARAKQLLQTWLTPAMKKIRPDLRERWMRKSLVCLGRIPKIQNELLQFIVVLPSLHFDRSGVEVYKQFRETLGKVDRILKELNQSFFLKIGGRFLTGLIRNITKIVPKRMLAVCIRSGIRFTGRNFIAGETIEDCESTIRKLESKNKACTVDPLGELVVSESEADEYCKRVLKIIEYLGQRKGSGNRNTAGLPLAHISIKVSALASFCSGDDPEESYRRIAPRLKRIMKKGKDRQVFVNADAEHFPLRDLVTDILLRLLEEEPELRSQEPMLGVVVQAYLKDSLTHIQELATRAGKLGILLPVRLVKGAYWDEETALFTAHGNEVPQFQTKEATDGNFRLMMEEILSRPELQLTVASHNAGDHCYAIALRELRFPERPLIEHQFLFRTYDALSNALATSDYPVRDYIPCGNILVGMSYLVRRLLENSSQSGFLTAAANDPNKIQFEDTIRNYLQRHHRTAVKKLLPPNQFIPANQVELFRSSIRKLFQKAPAEYDNPASDIPIDHLKQWFQRSSNHDGFGRSCKVRILAFWKLAELMLRDRLIIAKAISKEARKTPSESIGDVNEAIDFIRYYCSQQDVFENQSPAESSDARGVFAVICPWNFPLAIPCGMATAALLTGNRVVFKPAEQTMNIGAMFVDYCYQAGIPTEFLSLVQGDGDTGASILDHTEIGNVVFTGSRAVGNHIMKTVRSRLQANNQLARVITEMGGKNGVIVTASADFDEAVAGILYATMAHAGQKCSAASRIIIDYRIAESFLERLSGALSDVLIGAPGDFSTLVNPLISSEEKQRVHSYLKEARAECEEFEGKVLLDRSMESEEPTLVGPVLIALPTSRFLDPMSTSRKEAFAPILHTTTYTTLEEAMKLLHATEYGLTAGIFSQSSKDISFFLSQARAGNLYVNRANTGARVAIEPFGGFFQSGTGPKTGGPDYLPAFRTYNFNYKQLSKVDGVYYTSAWLEGSRFNVRSNRKWKSWKKMGREIPALVLEKDEAKAPASKSIIPQWQQRFASIYEESRNGITHYRIPGQWNFDSTELLKNRVALLVEKDWSLPLVLRLLAGLYLGNQITILALSEQSFGVAKALQQLQNTEKLSLKNPSRVSILEAARSMAQDEWDHVYIDACLETTRSLLDQCLQVENGASSLSSLATVHDGLDSSPESILHELVYTRSIAINTLRHGANIDLVNSVRGVQK